MVDLREAEDIKKRWQEYTEDYCVSSYIVQKDLQDPDNHDGVITNLKPDILEWKSSGHHLGSITMNKASGGDGVQLSYFRS